MPNKEKHPYSIQSVENALDVLEALCNEGDEFGVSHLSKRLGMTKMSLFRYLATFEGRGYVEKTKTTGRYRIGVAAYETGQKLLTHNSLLRVAKPNIEKLARQCNEAVYLAVPSNNEILMLDMVDTTQQIKIIPLLGNRYPVPRTTAGRVMLSHCGKLRESCGDSKKDSTASQLTVISEQNYDVDRGGFGEGIASLAVPLIDGDSEIVGSICIVGPEFRLTRKFVDETLLPKLVDTGIVVSSKLGYVGHFMEKTIYR